MDLQNVVIKVINVNMYVMDMYVMYAMYVCYGFAECCYLKFSNL